MTSWNTNQRTRKMLAVPRYDLGQERLTRQRRVINIIFSDDGIVRKVKHCPRRVVESWLDFGRIGRICHIASVRHPTSVAGAIGYNSDPATAAVRAKLPYVAREAVATRACAFGLRNRSMRSGEPQTPQASIVVRKCVSRTGYIANTAAPAPAKVEVGNRSERPARVFKVQPSGFRNTRQDEPRRSRYETRITKCGYNLRDLHSSHDVTGATGGYKHGV